MEDIPLDFGLFYEQMLQPVYQSHRFNIKQIAAQAFQLFVPI